MNKKPLTVLVALGALLTSAVALAVGWSSAFTISSIEVDDTGSGTVSFVVYAGSPPSGIPSCGTGVNQFVAGGSADNIKAMTTLATAAFLAGRQVKTYFDGTCTNGANTCTTAGPNCYAKFKYFVIQ